MANIQVSIALPADPATVWDDVQQLETHVEWMADAESIEFEGEQQRGVGTVMRVLTKVGPLQTTDVIRVVSWEPNRTIGVVHEGIGDMAQPHPSCPSFLLSSAQLLRQTAD